MLSDNLDTARLAERFAVAAFGAYNAAIFAGQLKRDAGDAFEYDLFRMCIKSAWTFVAALDDDEAGDDGYWEEKKKAAAEPQP